LNFLQKKPAAANHPIKVIIDYSKRKHISSYGYEVKTF